jgi:hypothetical protein
MKYQIYYGCVATVVTDSLMIARGNINKEPDKSK